jgi:hypothetical protein
VKCAPEAAASNHSTRKRQHSPRIQSKVYCRILSAIMSPAHTKQNAASSSKPVLDCQARALPIVDGEAGAVSLEHGPGSRGARRLLCGPSQGMILAIGGGGGGGGLGSRRVHLYCEVMVITSMLFGILHGPLLPFASKRARLCSRGGGGGVGEKLENSQRRPPSHRNNNVQTEPKYG